MATIDVPQTPQLDLPQRVSPRRRSTRTVLLWANGFALLAVAVFLRCWHLGNIPGLNGDEAWYGVQALRVVHGESISWLTPTRNLLNPFYFLPLVALHYCFVPSVALLRAVAVASGLTALVVNYLLCRRAFDRRTAYVSTIVLAVLPIDIVYSRFGWDASQSLLATLLVLYLPLIQLRPNANQTALGAGAMFALAAAILVHPTNVFAIVLLIVPTIFRYREVLLRWVRTRRLPAKPAVFAALVGIVALGAWLAFQLVPTAAHRLSGPRDVGPFVAGYVKLFSGTTVYQFVSGAGLTTPEAGWYAYTTIAGTAGCVLLGMWALWGFILRVSREADPADICLCWGWALMLAAFFVVAGPRAIAPHYERYAICLVAPAALVLCRGVGWWTTGRGARSQRLVVALALAAWLWPAGFYINYFRAIEERGGMSHVAFHTGEVDPKQSALEYVRSHSEPGRPVDLICHEWWSYWPLVYFGFDDPHVRVWMWDRWQQASAADRAAQTWFVEFGGSDGQRDAMRLSEGTRARRHAIVDYGFRPAIWVIGPLEKISQNY
jgi:4-amino-4-deoxy-L-arabinose transferase-like glycosyltransferase